MLVDGPVQLDQQLSSCACQTSGMCAGLVSAVLRARLDKTQQCSAWHLRPLSAAQLAYAANDAAVLLALLDALTAAAARAGLISVADQQRRLAHLR